MAEEKALTPQLNKSQIAIISGKTPSQFIKQRPGRGGKSFSYVEVGYIIQTLNEAFKLAWDWEIEDQQIAKTQVWVKGKLTVWFSPDFKVAKSAFGGADIKLDRTTGNSIDIGDDLKAASADALKKAASFLGISSDVYFPQLDRLSDDEAIGLSTGDPDNKCTNCGRVNLPEAVVSFSLKNYGRVLCYDCQELVKTGALKA